MNKHPGFPRIPVELSSQIFELAKNIYDLRPWEKCTDSDLFGVLVSETKELHFVSVMGGAGECFGISTYRGLYGLGLFNELVDSGGFFDPREFQRRQDGILLEFTSKKYLEPEDLALHKEIGFKPKDSKGWIFCRDLKPGWVQWGISEKDALALRTVLSVIPEFHQRQLKDSDWAMGKSGRTVPVFVRLAKTKSWKVEWWGEQKIAQASLLSLTDLANSPIDELKLSRIKKSAKQTNEVWEAYDFFAYEPVLEKDRPFYPRILAILDQASEACLGMEVISPEKSKSLALRDLLLSVMEKTGMIPTALVFENPEDLIGFATLEEVFGIELILDEAECGLIFEAEFHDRFAGDQG